MKILAVEFSSEHRSVAVLDDTPGPVLLGEACEVGGRRAIDLVERALAAARCEREEIGAIAIGLGPGSYTGIRGAISLAQGWQLGRDVKLLGISSVECMAAKLAAMSAPMTAHLVIDAQRNEFYVAKYEIVPGSWQEIEVLRLVPAAYLIELAKSGQAVYGPELALRIPEATELFPDAATLGKLAARRSDFIGGSDLEPIYLRQADYKKAPPRRVIS